MWGWGSLGRGQAAVRFPTCWKQLIVLLVDWREERWEVVGEMLFFPVKSLVSHPPLLAY